MAEGVGLVSEKSWQTALAEAERAFVTAGVPSPRVDAELLAAHIARVPRSEVRLLTEAEPAALREFTALVARRVTRVPLQYLLGTAPMGPVDVRVGPGVFVPRLETELLVEWGLTCIAGTPEPVVVDLCTGSGALAAAVATSRVDAAVHAVELDSEALSWARKNLPARVRLVQGDVTDRELLPELRGRVDLLLANPPYVPEGTPVPPEVADHDPHRAVFAGADGLDVIRPLVVLAIRLLRAGGKLGVEHDDTHGESAPAVLAGHPELTDVRTHSDLAGRPRFVTATRRGDQRVPAP